MQAARVAASKNKIAVLRIGHKKLPLNAFRKPDGGFRSGTDQGAQGRIIRQILGPMIETLFAVMIFIPAEFFNPSLRKPGSSPPRVR